MKHPALVVEDRTPIWDYMQHLYMDTDVSLLYDSIAQRCANSKYTIDELEKILFNEVLPALKFNMICFPIPEWAGFQTEWVVERILSKHRYGKPKPWILRRYTQAHWTAIKQKIEQARHAIA